MEYITYVESKLNNINLLETNDENVLALACEVLIRLQNFEGALNLYRRSLEDLNGDGNIFTSSLIRSLSRNNLYKIAYKIYCRRGDEANAYCLSSILTAAGDEIKRTGELEILDDAFVLLKDYSGKVNTVVYNSMIRCAGEGKDVDLAFKVYTMMCDEKGLKPNIRTYGSLMTALSISSVNRVNSVFDLMGENSIIPNEYVLGAAIGCYLRTKELEKAKNVLWRMVCEGWGNVESFNAVIGGCVEEKDWEGGVEVEGRMWFEGVKVRDFGVKEICDRYLIKFSEFFF